jgi:hypothetical protein
MFQLQGVTSCEPSHAQIVVLWRTTICDFNLNHSLTSISLPAVEIAKVT